MVPLSPISSCTQEWLQMLPFCSIGVELQFYFSFKGFKNLFLLFKLALWLLLHTHKKNVVFGEQITEMVRPDSYLYRPSQREEQRYGYGRRRSWENCHKSQSKDIGLHLASLWLCFKKDKYASLWVCKAGSSTVSFLTGSPSPLGAGVRVTEGYYHDGAYSSWTVDFPTFSCTHSDFYEIEYDRLLKMSDKS